MSANEELPQGIASPARPFSCPACARRFVVVAGRSIAEAPRCVCGAPLTPTSFSSGIYEIRRSRRATRRRPPRASSPPAHGATPREEDLGYGESHGYGPAHGGPTGPGDAPATEEVESSPPVSEGSATDVGDAA
jgi:hypothetical protein